MITVKRPQIQILNLETGLIETQDAKAGWIVTIGRLRLRIYAAHIWRYLWRSPNELFINWETYRFGGMSFSLVRK